MRTARRGKDAGQKGTNHASDSVKLENIHALIDMQPLVYIFHKRADHGREETDDGSQPNTDITSSRGDAHKPGDSTLASPNNAEAAFVLDVIDQNLDFVSFKRSKYS
jgi:hypothetical protein